MVFHVQASRCADYIAAQRSLTFSFGSAFLKIGCSKRPKSPLYIDILNYGDDLAVWSSLSNTNTSRFRSIGCALPLCQRMHDSRAHINIDGLPRNSAHQSLRMLCFHKNLRKRCAMRQEWSFRTSHVHFLGMAGLGRNVGFGANKVFTSALLQTLIASQPLIGLILGLEGLFGIFINPLTGWLSDRTTASGLRRKIYTGVCLPGAAIAWLVFCYSHHIGVATFAICLFYAFQQGSLSPYQAWMPELVPMNSWGVASGYLNFWWQLGSLLSFLAIPLIWNFTHSGAYVLTAALIAAGGLLTTIVVPERAASNTSAASSHRVSYWPLFRRNLLLYFLSQALAWVAFESIASFFTLYILHAVHGTLMDSAIAMSLFTLTGMIAAIFSGRLYNRVSPRLLLMIALGFFGIFAFLGLYVHNLVVVIILVSIEGVFWSGNMTVSFAFATDLLRQAVAHEGKEDAMRGGLYGVSNLVQSVGLLHAAPISGFVIAASGGKYQGMFLVSSVAALISMLLVLMIRPQTRHENLENTLSQ